MGQFRTHTGEVVSGARLQAALNEVANDIVILACRMRVENPYAAHVKDAEKDDELQRDLDLAAEIRAGQMTALATRQAINHKLTGVCVPLLAPHAPNSERNER